MKCLITGCNGFIGSYLAESLVNRGVVVYGTVHRSRERIAHLADRITTFECEILDEWKLDNVVAQVKPDVVFHLAAQSKVVPSWQDAELTFRVNVLGTLYLLEAVRKAGIDPVVVVVGAASVYGSSKDEAPIREDQELRPSSPYAVSKVAQDFFAGLYWPAYGVRVVRVRPFNITGPSMVGDACSDFAKGIVEIEKGEKGSLSVGDLDSVRDLTDVRDAVEALWLVAEKGASGAVYNLCSGKGHRVGDLLNKLISMASVKVDVVQDGVKKRVLEDRFQIGDNFRLLELGWRPVISIDDTLSDMLEYWRKSL